MYFSKKIKKQFIQKIIDAGEKVFCIKLHVGWCDLTDLEEITNLMFKAWEIISTRRSGYIRNYSGILRRFFIEYDKEKSLCCPYFILICVTAPNKFKYPEWKLKLKAYTNWLTAWSTALQCSTDVYVDFNMINLLQLEHTIDNFCDRKLTSIIDSGLLNTDELMYIKKAVRNHRLVAVQGIFNKNRHVSVLEENER